MLSKNMMLCDGCVVMFAAESIISLYFSFSLNLWFEVDARGSLHVEEMIKIFNEMDAAISDIFKQIMSDKCPIGEDHETKATHKKGKGLELVWSEQHPSLMRPKEPGTYSPEMFCANELPYMIKQGHKPTAVFDAALTPNPKVSISPMAKVVKERDYFRNKCNTID